MIIPLPPVPVPSATASNGRGESVFCMDHGLGGVEKSTR